MRTSKPIILLLVMLLSLGFEIVHSVWNISFNEISIIDDTEEEKEDTLTEKKIQPSVPFFVISNSIELIKSSNIFLFEEMIHYHAFLSLPEMPPEFTA